MKKFTAWMVLAALAVPAIMAQETEYATDQNRDQREVQTIFDGRRGNGGYGAFTIGYTQINHRDGLILGGRGEWVVGHGFGLGIGGYGFLNDPVYD
ncbi:MAG TPA: hypothetical protein ENO20_10555, partial [Bacteroides sp.]|nr:hypothetical protein [Bacteroides sp.]